METQSSNPNIMSTRAEEEMDGVLGTDNGFEGPEKILEIDFNPKFGSGKGARLLTRECWDEILDLARCQILTKMSNEYCDAYVLSESSLFVYSHKIFIKTCGTTTLLRCLPKLLMETEKIGMELEWIGYTRKNFTFPEVQEFPHGSFSQEIEYTKKCFGPKGGPLKGGAYVLGDILGDHWFVYVADHTAKVVDNSERNVNIMMYGMDESVARQFFRREELTMDQDAGRVREDTGIIGLCGNAMIDDCMFEPCGYSMNGLEGRTFYTIHVTPEEAFSYASFETNLEIHDYTELVQNVLHVFKPTRFVVTMFADDSAMAQIEQCPTQIQSLSLGNPEGETCFDTYTRVTQSTTCIRDDYICRMSSYHINEKDK